MPGSLGTGGVRCPASPGGARELGRQYLESMAARPLAPPLLPELPPLAPNPHSGRARRRVDAEWRRFYAHPSVRRRHLEYLGGRTLQASPTAFLSSPSPGPDARTRFYPVTDLPELLATAFESTRSLWDRNALLVHLDIEHVHFDRPWEPLLYPKRSLFVQRGVVQTVQVLLGEFGLDFLHLLTGRGHHFIWKVARRSEAFTALSRLASLGERARVEYTTPQPPAGAVLGERAGEAWSGLGKVMEYLGQRILGSNAQSPVPVQLTPVVVGPGAHGREIVAIDLSEYADPLHKRAVRMPFIAYLETEPHGSVPPAPLELPRLIAIPDPGDEEEGIRIMRDPDLAAVLARQCRTTIPDASEGMKGLIAAYENSDLADFHRRFDSQEADPPELWPTTYDRIDLGALPACAARVLEHPNDLMLQPGAIQLLVRVLLAQGWQPRHVAGLIRSKFERPYGWLPNVHFHDPAMRAEVYTRLFAGLIAVGNDQMVDFNCTSTQEKFLCPDTGCPWKLEALRSAAQSGGGRG